MTRRNYNNIVTNIKFRVLLVLLDSGRDRSSKGKNLPHDIVSNSNYQSKTYYDHEKHEHFRQAL